MLALVVFLALSGSARAEVGDGKAFARIEDALAAVASGGEIDVYPSSKGYRETALLVKKPVHLVAKGRVVLSGDGFSYSGSRRIPRAIVQIEPSALGSSIRGFTIRGAHNDTFNGAGVRIREASDVTVSNCRIFENDMGIMSNGQDGDAGSAARQRILGCSIHDNGNKRAPGYNHNLYVGGASVYIDRCAIYDPITGHNLKSRARLTWVSNSVIYGGNNRQIDCVDSWFTGLPHSDLMVYNSILAMDPNSVGNGNVIHFGQENGRRDGCAYLYQSSIYTEFLTPILTLDSFLNRADVKNCVVLDPDPITPQFLSTPPGYPRGSAMGSGDLFSAGYQLGALRISAGGFAFEKVVSVTPTVPGAQATGFGLSGPGIRTVMLKYEGRALPSWARPGARGDLYRTIQLGLQVFRLEKASPRNL